MSADKPTVSGPSTELIIDAICGAGTGSMEDSANMQALGLQRFTGNQWNANWEWNREALKTRKSFDELHDIYIKIKTKVRL